MIDIDIVIRRGNEGCHTHPLFLCRKLLPNVIHPVKRNRRGADKSRESAVRLILAQTLIDTGSNAVNTSCRVNNDLGGLESTVRTDGRIHRQIELEKEIKVAVHLYDPCVSIVTDKDVPLVRNGDIRR